MNLYECFMPDLYTKQIHSVANCIMEYYYRGTIFLEILPKQYFKNKILYHISTIYKIEELMP